MGKSSLIRRYITFIFTLCRTLNHKNVRTEHTTPSPHSSMSVNASNVRKATTAHRKVKVTSQTGVHQAISVQLEQGMRLRIPAPLGITEMRQPQYLELTVVFVCLGCIVT